MIRTLFFLSYYAYLRGDLSKTTMYYELLMDEFKNKDRQPLLKDNQLTELEKIKGAIDIGGITKTQWLDVPIAQGPSTQPIAECRQDDIVKEIDKNVDQLNVIFQDNLSLYNIEHPCGEYGRIDMVYMGSKGTIYPIEVKKDQGKHDLIGQISKYELFFRLHLHYNFYSDVCMGSICSSYQPFALNELKQRGVKTLTYSMTDKLGLKLL